VLEGREGRMWENYEDGEFVANNVYTLIEMEKMIYVETIPGMGGGCMKENSGLGEFKHNIFGILEELL
jgi:hypothetical protein